MSDNPYLNARETAIVVDLVASVTPRVVLEFGCNSGRTAKAILDQVPSIECYVGVDVPRDYVPALTCQRGEIPLRPGYYARRDPRFELMILPDGTRGLRSSLELAADAIFIDGDHSYFGAMHDSKLARALVRAGGIIIWHDAGNPTVEVTAVLEDLMIEGWSLEQVENSWLAFMRVAM